jgi:ELWxxDGT repeat protein
VSLQGRKCLCVLAAALVWLACCSVALAAPGDVTVTLINIDGAAESAPADLFNANGTLLFGANTTAGGFELWRSNGGQVGSGTDPVLPEIASGTQDANPNGFASIGGTVFFIANDGSGPSEHGAELWKIDPPYTTPAMVEDVNPTAGVSSDPSELTNVGGTLFFAADDGTNGSELWKSTPPYDAASTSPVKDINTASGAGSFPNDLASVNGKLFFTAAQDGVADYELWKSDGTVPGTVMVEDINPAAGVGSNPGELTDANGTLLFQADDGTNGAELWKSAGPNYNSGSTSMVSDINVGADSNPTHLTDLNGTLFFEAEDTGSDFELFRSASPYTSTHKIDVNPGGSSDPAGLVNIGGTLFFRATGAGTTGSELWKSNGGPVNAGTNLVANINPTASSTPTEITGVGGQVFFRADDSSLTTDRELWKSVSPFTSATRVADIRPGLAASDPTFLTDVNGTLFFRANDGTTGGRELFKATIEPTPPPPPTSNPPAPAPAVPTTTKKKCKKKHGKKSAASAKKKKCKKKKK